MIPQGKGKSDLASCGLCSKLASDPQLIQRRVPMYILTDPNPFDYLIASLFKNGSQRMNFYPNLCARNAIRIGVTPLDLRGLINAIQPPSHTPGTDWRARLHTKGDWRAGPHANQLQGRWPARQWSLNAYVYICV
jgi:hypothetical protein